MKIIYGIWLRYYSITLQGELIELTKPKNDEILSVGVLHTGNGRESVEE